MRPFTPADGRLACFPASPGETRGSALEHVRLFRSPLRMPRAKILSSLEQEAYDAPPQFTDLERKRHFEPAAGLMRIAENLRNSTNQVCFLVECGYFSGTKRFFSEEFVAQDVEYVAKQLGVPLSEVDVSG